MTSNGPFDLGISLDLHLLGNISFLRWIHTKSLGWNWVSLLCLLARCFACSLDFSILSLTLACSSWISFALFSASKLNLVGLGIGTRSNGLQGLYPYATLKGKRLVALLGARLNANSAWGSKSPHPFMLFLTRTLNKVPKVLLVTSAWSSVWGWQVVLKLRWVLSFLHKVSQKWLRNLVSLSETMLLGSHEGVLSPWSRGL